MYEARQTDGVLPRCSATSATAAATVSVLLATTPWGDRLDDSADEVLSYDKLVAVQRFLAAGKPRQAEENLEAFLAQVAGQRGKGLTPEQADALQAAGERILAVIAS